MSSESTTSTPERRALVELLHNALSTSQPSASLRPSLATLPPQPSALGTPDNFVAETFPHIGQGSCGIVFGAPPGSTSSNHNHAWKQALPGQRNPLDYEHTLQKRVHSTFLSALRSKLFPHEDLARVPEARTYIRDDSTEWWTANGPRFPDGWRNATDIHVSERIPPLAAPARSALTQLYCPAQHCSSALVAPANVSCLARVYLGMRKPTRTKSVLRGNIFSLRNFPLYLDRIEELGLINEAREWARQMAAALALCHWVLSIDANDVEFVLGSVGGATGFEEGTNIWRAEEQGKSGVQLWLLDFDKVKSMAWDGAGVEQAVLAVESNDWYFPKPPASGGDQEVDKIEAELWEVFQETYLGAAARVAAWNREDGDVERDGERITTLAQDFVRRWTEVRAEKVGRWSIRY